MPATAVALALAVGSVLGVSRVKASRRGGIAVSMHRVPWERRMRVIQLTDVHVGPTTPRSVLRRAADVVGSLEPDVVVLTGDYVNTSLFFVDRVTDLVEWLPKPCLAILGNHDHWAGPEKVGKALRAGGAEVLRNESRVVETAAGALVVVGVDDGTRSTMDIERAFRAVDARRALVLAHHPQTADHIAKKGAPLVLSGHTHGGQIDVPRVTERVAKLTGNPYLHGFYRIDETDLYVNAGIGHSLPGFRAGRTCPEIAVFDLDPNTQERRSIRMQTSLS